MYWSSKYIAYFVKHKVLLKGEVNMKPKAKLSSKDIHLEILKLQHEEEQLRQQSIESAYYALNSIRRLVDPANLNEPIPIDESILSKLPSGGVKRKQTRFTKSNNIVNDVVEEKCDNQLPLKHYRGKITNLQAELKLLLVDRDELQKLLDCAQADIRKKDEANSMLENTLKEYEELKPLLDTTMSEVEGKDRTIEGFEAKMNELSKEKIELQKLLDCAENALNKKDEIFEDHKKTITELHEKNADLEKEYLRLKALTDMQEIVLQDEQAKIEDNKQTEKQLEKLINELQAQNETLRQEVSKLKDEISSIELSEPEPNVEIEPELEQASRLDREELKILNAELLQEVSNLRMENISLHKENVARIQVERELCEELQTVKSQIDTTSGERERKFIRSETNPQMGKALGLAETGEKDESKDESDLYSVGSNSDCSESEFSNNISRKLWEIELERVIQEKEEAEGQTANLESLLLKSQEKFLKLNQEHEKSMEILSKDHESQKELVKTLTKEIDRENLIRSELENLTQEKDEAEKKVANLENLLLRSQETILKMSKEHDESVNGLTKGLEAVVLDCKNQKELVNSLQKQLDSSWFK